MSLSLHVVGALGQLGNKCAIPACDSPRYIDPSGQERDCCGCTHAMELQRRQAIQSGMLGVLKVKEIAVSRAACPHTALLFY